ncbi:OLC1v1015704C1 [Oldenlandia corymbosa var. corymbosa]|uniref:OLC1v1015704C1 n=1 Tax=Oldenlandia corymbosa var. corymbosa TaxID=529605 RepID=A0AAV1E605_OLDCO|nr:OLC1v1015704C1 [Oldenlandia corymbosa var. corymbosa]
MGNCWPFRLIVMVAILAVSISFKSANSDPQTTLLNKGCRTTYRADNVTNFYINFNETLADIRNQLISKDNKHFATAQKLWTSNTVFVLFQCREYLSTADCVSCFDTAASPAQECYPYDGILFLYDGCYLRQEASFFFDQATQSGNGQTCGNQTASQPTVFQTQAQALLQDLKRAAPRIKGFFAASKRQFSNGSDAVYAVAQCTETISPSGCEFCLKLVYFYIDICLPNIDGRGFDAGCFMRFSANPFFADNQTTNINPYLGVGGGSSNRTKTIILGAVGVGLFLLILALLLWYQLCTKPKKVEKRNIFGTTELRGHMIYDYKTLKSATRNFLEENKLGEGGFSEVYKRTMGNGKVVAVKKLNITSGKAKSEFVNEVKLISNVHHRNLVRLLAYATKGAELLLVYEYLANGSLDRFLYVIFSLPFLSVPGNVFDIHGLAYLHEKYYVCIIHRDIKSSNILLDDDFQPKIADFGLAKLLPGDRTHLSTGFAGTLGYVAPKYVVHGHLSEKADTYGFGIVILEIISGQRSNNTTVAPVSESLLDQVNFKQS